MSKLAWQSLNDKWHISKYQNISLRRHFLTFFLLLGLLHISNCSSPIYYKIQQRCSEMIGKLWLSKNPICFYEVYRIKDYDYLYYLNCGRTHLLVQRMGPSLTIFTLTFITQFQTLLFENIGINLLTKVGHSKGIDLTQPSSKTPVSWERIVGEEWMPSHRENELSHWQVDQ